MFLLFLKVCLTIALLAALTHAAPQDDWIFPANPDQTSKLVTGDKYTIKWNSNLKNWFAEYCDACNTQNVDLWILGGTNFHKLSSGINVETTLSYTWTPDIPSSELNVDLWVFRFLASGVDFKGTETDSIASPIFFLSKGDGNSQTTVGQTSTTKTAEKPKPTVEEPVNTRVDETTKTNIVEVTKTKEEAVKTETPTDTRETETTTEKNEIKADTSTATKETGTSVAIKVTSTTDQDTSVSTSTATSPSLEILPKPSSITASSLLPLSSVPSTFDPLITALETDPALLPHDTASPIPNKSNSNAVLSKGAIIGVVVGVAVGTALFCLSCYFCVQRRKKRQNPDRGESPVPLKRGLSSYDGDARSQFSAPGYNYNVAVAGVGVAGYNPDPAAGYGAAYTQNSPTRVALPLSPEAEAAALPGTWIYDSRDPVLGELQGDGARAELEHMPLPELPATSMASELPASPVAAELPIYGHDRNLGRTENSGG